MNLHCKTLNFYRVSSKLLEIDILILNFPWPADGLSSAVRLQLPQSFMFKLFRAGPGQGDGLTSAEHLQSSSKFMFKLFRAGPGQG